MFVITVKGILWDWYIFVRFNNKFVVTELRHEFCIIVINDDPDMRRRIFVIGVMRKVVNLLFACPLFAFLFQTWHPLSNSLMYFTLFLTSDLSSSFLSSLIFPTSSFSLISWSAIFVFFLVRSQRIHSLSHTFTHTHTHTFKPSNARVQLSTENGKRTTLPLFFSISSQSVRVQS